MRIPPDLVVHDILCHKYLADFMAVLEEVAVINVYELALPTLAAACFSTVVRDLP